jgi:Spy/CpxP family protein refolding chaperone
MKPLLNLQKVLLGVTVVLGLSLYSLVVNAQPDRNSNRAGQREGPEQLISQLGINDEQRESFLSIMKEQHDKRMNIHQQYRGARDKVHKAIMTLHQETLERLQQVLSAEQITQFEQLMKQRRPHKGEGRPARR